jgi:nucleoside 2-deoxyribosyltransferase
MALKIYLAGPDVFLPEARRVGRQKQHICREFGFEGLFPLDNNNEAVADAAKIFRANCSLMLQADIGLFNLTPFRGPSADAGTVFELGFLFARAKPVYGYTGAVKSYRERVAAAGGLHVDHPSDRDGYAIENFGLGDNLMIARAIEDSGGVITAVEETPGEESEYLAAFQAFKACLKVISERINTTDVRTA